MNPLSDLVTERDAKVRRLILELEEQAIESVSRQSTTPDSLTRENGATVPP